MNSLEALIAKLAEAEVRERAVLLAAGVDSAYLDELAAELKVAAESESTVEEAALFEELYREALAEEAHDAAEKATSDAADHDTVVPVAPGALLATAWVESSRSSETNAPALIWAVNFDVVFAKVLDPHAGAQQCAAWAGWDGFSLHLESVQQKLFLRLNGVFAREYEQCFVAIASDCRALARTTIQRITSVDPIWSLAHWGMPTGYNPPSGETMVGFEEVRLSRALSLREKHSVHAGPGPPLCFDAPVSRALAHEVPGAVDLGSLFASVNPDHPNERRNEKRSGVVEDVEAIDHSNPKRSTTVEHI